jgi:hypothetical protein
MRVPFQPYPSWWNDPDTTDADRVQWSTQERCRRQAIRQHTPYAERVKQTAEREQRRLEARPDSVPVAEYR